MAKKAKTIEIKSVPTEPQRGAGQEASADDPVGIYYPVGGIARLIGSLAGGEEDEAVIKTGGCIVQHDINVRYAAPTAEVTIPVYVATDEYDASTYVLKETITAEPGTPHTTDTTDILTNETYDGMSIVDYADPAETCEKWIAEYHYFPRDGINVVEFVVPNINAAQLSAFNAIVIKHIEIETGENEGQ